MGNTLMLRCLQFDGGPNCLKAKQQYCWRFRLCAGLMLRLPATLEGRRSFSLFELACFSTRKVFYNQERCYQKDATNMLRKISFKMRVIFDFGEKMYFLIFFSLFEIVTPINLA